MDLTSEPSDPAVINSTVFVGDVPPLAAINDVELTIETTGF
jgi:hypothetical protein